MFIGEADEKRIYALKMISQTNATYPKLELQTSSGSSNQLLNNVDVYQTSFFSLWKTNQFTKIRKIV